jgi:hypothetical protein
MSHDYDVGNVLHVNFVQGEDYLQQVAIYAQNAHNSAVQAEDSAVRAANSAVSAANSALSASRSAEASANSAAESADYANQSKGHMEKAKEYYSKTVNTYDAVCQEIANSETTFDKKLSVLHNSVSQGFYQFGNDISTINEWIDFHNDAFALVDFGLLDNTGPRNPNSSITTWDEDFVTFDVAVKDNNDITILDNDGKELLYNSTVVDTGTSTVILLDNDGVPFMGQMYAPVTDTTLTLQGIPADAYTVGQIVNSHAKAIEELDAIVDDWEGNFVEADVAITDNDNVPILDNDGYEFLTKSIRLLTDSTLTEENVPADSFAVGQALDGYSRALNSQAQALKRVDEILEEWQDNFVQIAVAIADSDGGFILDNDGGELLTDAMGLETDSTLTMEGVPADAYAVGQALQAIRDLIKTYHP